MHCLILSHFVLLLQRQVDESPIVLVTFVLTETQSCTPTIQRKGRSILSHVSVCVYLAPSHNDTAEFHGGGELRRVVHGTIARIQSEC